MADTKHAPHGGYSPDMDSRAHEATYNGFIQFAEIATAVVICHVLALAVGGYLGLGGADSGGSCQRFAGRSLSHGTGQFGHRWRKRSQAGTFEVWSQKAEVGVGAV